VATSQYSKPTKDMVKQTKSIKFLPLHQRRLTMEFTLQMNF